MTTSRAEWIPSDGLRKALVAALDAESVVGLDAERIADLVLEIVADHASQQAEGSMVWDPRRAAKVVRALIAEPTLGTDFFEAIPEDLVEMIRFVKCSDDPTMDLEQLALELEAMVRPGRPLTIWRDRAISELAYVLGYAFRNDLWPRKGKGDANPEVVHTICNLIVPVFREAGIPLPKASQGEQNSATQERLNRLMKACLVKHRKEIELQSGEEPLESWYQSRVPPGRS